MFARFLLTNGHTARKHGKRTEMMDCADDLRSDCLYQSSNKHRRSNDLKGHWVDAKDARAGHERYVSEC